MEAEVAGKVDQAAIIDDALSVPFAGNGRLHLTTKDLVWCATDRLGGAMAAKHCLQMRPDVAPPA